MGVPGNCVLINLSTPPFLEDVAAGGVEVAGEDEAAGEAGAVDGTLVVAGGAELAAGGEAVAAVGVDDEHEVIVATTTNKTAVRTNKDPGFHFIVRFPP